MAHDIKTLLEQTEFLLKKQQEAQADCKNIFNDLLSSARVKLDQAKKESSQDAEHLEQVIDLIADQAQSFDDEAQTDIEFLGEQRDALQQIHAEGNPVKAQELMSMLIDEEETIKDTPTFMKEVADEAQSSRESLMAMVNDIKDAIKEGNAQDIALYLESVLVDEDEGMDDDGDADIEWETIEEDEEGGCGDDCECGLGSDKKCSCNKVDASRHAHEENDEEESGCGGCKGCGSGDGCGAGCGSDSRDLFGDLSKFEAEFFKDTNEKIKH